MYVDEYFSQADLLNGAVQGITLGSNTKHEVLIGNWFSPLKFHIVFTAHEEKVTKHFDYMNQIYSDHSNEIENVTFSVGRPCVVKDLDGVWRRAKLDINGAKEYHVTIVDLGYETCIPIENAKRLLRKFTKYPPLAVQCRLNKCHKDICYGDMLEKMRKNCQVGRLRTVCFKSKKMPLDVDLFDMKKNDLFEMYFGPLLRKMEVAKAQRADAIARGWSKKKKKRKAGSPSTDEEYVFGSDEDRLDFSSGVPVLIPGRKITIEMENKS